MNNQERFNQISRQLKEDLLSIIGDDQKSQDIVNLCMSEVNRSIVYWINVSNIKPQENGDPRKD